MPMNNYRFKYSRNVAYAMMLFGGMIVLVHALFVEIWNTQLVALPPDIGVLLIVMGLLLLVLISAVRICRFMICERFEWGGDESE